MAKAAAEGLGIQALAADLGWKLGVRVWVNSSAAKSIASRQGLGRVRHLEVKNLWVQEAVRAGRFEVRKIAGTQNPSDLVTKPHGAREASAVLGTIGGVLRKHGGLRCRPRWADSEDSVKGRSVGGGVLTYQHTSRPYHV